MKKTTPAAADGKAKSPEGPGLVRTLVALVLFAGVTTGATMYSVSLFDDARDARIEAEDSDDVLVDSIYSDRVEGQYDADYDRTRYQEIAKSFETDPIFIDEYQAFEIDDKDLADLATELDGLEVPIYVAILSTSEVDGADGDADLTANRIARELEVDQASVMVIGNLSQGLGNKGVVRTWDEKPTTEMHETYSRTALNYARALKDSEIYDGGAIYSSTTDENGDPIVVNEDTSTSARELEYGAGSAVAGASFGLLVGGGLTVTGVIFVRAYIQSRNQKNSPARTPTGTNRKN